MPARSGCRAFPRAPRPPRARASGLRKDPRRRDARRSRALANDALLKLDRWLRRVREPFQLESGGPENNPQGLVRQRVGRSWRGAGRDFAGGSGSGCDATRGRRTSRRPAGVGGGLFADAPGGRSRQCAVGVSPRRRAGRKERTRHEALGHQVPGEAAQERAAVLGRLLGVRAVLVVLPLEGPGALVPRRCA
jgi:hypothetical protein